MLNVRTFPQDEADKAQAFYDNKAVLARTHDHVKAWVSWDTIKEGTVVRFCRFKYAGVNWYVVIAQSVLGYAFCSLREGALCEGTLYIDKLTRVTKNYDETLRMYFGAPEFVPLEADAETARMITC